MVKSIEITQNFNLSKKEIYIYTFIFINLYPMIYCKFTILINKKYLSIKKMFFYAATYDLKYRTKVFYDEIFTCTYPLH